MANQDSQILDDNDETSEKEIDDSMHPKHRLALTLKNWSLIPENDTNLMSEGAVHALIALAGLDDNSVRICVASAFFHLSSREHNRPDLIKSGIINGLVNLAMHPTSFKIAKYCTLTFCNLSMCHDEEAAIAENGAILALGVLLGLRGHRLLPMCVQALYNLTCCGFHQHFKPESMRRIVKALINVPLSNFDHIPHLIKSIYNISRFSWIRSRMIEDGALHHLLSFAESIPNRPNTETNTSLAVSCLRMVSDVPSGRYELVIRGCMKQLYNLLLFCNSSSVLELVLVVYNLIQLNLPTPQFEAAAWIVTQVVIDWKEDSLVIMYCSACLYIFASHQQRLTFDCIKKILNASTSLLGISLELVQANVMATLEELYFNPNFKKTDDLPMSITKLIDNASKFDDSGAKRCLASCIARLAQDPFYLSLLSDMNLLGRTTELLLNLVERDATEVKVLESVCIAICYISIDGKRMTASVNTAMSEMVATLLNQDDANALRNAICSVRAMGSLFGTGNHEKLISDDILKRFAFIIDSNPNDILLIRNTVAVLAVFSHNPETHTKLAIKEIVKIVLNLSQTDDMSLRELVVTLLCNLSTTDAIKESLIEFGLIESLTALSSSTNEMIQEITAKCICNLTCIKNLHEIMITKGLLDLLMMISLVRSSSTITRSLCARSLLNLISDQNFPQLCEANVIRIFSSLSSANDIPTTGICARGFLILTGEEAYRAYLIQRPPALQAMFSMINCSYEPSRLMVGIGICNLLCCPVAQATAISFGALSILKILAVCTDTVVKEAVVRVIVNLTRKSNLRDTILKESPVPILVLFLQQQNEQIFHVTLHANLCMAQIEAFRCPMVHDGCVTAITSAVYKRNTCTSLDAVRICQIVGCLSFCKDRVESIVSNSRIMLLFQALYRLQAYSGHSANLVAIILRNISDVQSVKSLLVKEDGVRLVALIMNEILQNPLDNITFFRECIFQFLHNICSDAALHADILEQGMLNILWSLTTGKITTATATGNCSTDDVLVNSDPSLSPRDMQFIAKALNLLAQTSECQLPLINSKYVTILCKLEQHRNMKVDTLHEIACCLCTLSAIKNNEGKQALFDQGAAAMLTSIANSTNRKDTQGKCSLGLGYLSSYTKVNEGVVSSMLLLSLMQEEIDNDDDEKTTTVDSVASKSTSGDGIKSTASSEEYKSEASLIMHTKKSNYNKSFKSLLQEGLRTRKAASNVKKIELNPFMNDLSMSCKTTMIAGMNPQELNLLVFDPSPYTYEIITSTVPVEMAGMATPASFSNTSLPKVMDRDDNDILARFAELPNIPTRTDPLDKDFTCVSMEMELKDQKIDHKTSAEENDSFDGVMDLSPINKRHGKKGSRRSSVASSTSSGSGGHASSGSKRFTRKMDRSTSVGSSGFVNHLRKDSKKVTDGIRDSKMASNLNQSTNARRNSRFSISELSGNIKTASSIMNTVPTEI